MPKKAATCSISLDRGDPLRSTEPRIAVFAGRFVQQAVRYGEVRNVIGLVGMKDRAIHHGQ